MAFSVSAFGLDEGQLPRGWIADRLDTLASLNPEQIGVEYPHSEIAYVDIGNVAAGVAGEPAKLSLSDAPSRAQRIVRSQDTILSTVRPGNRAYAFLRDAPDNLVVSTGFAVIRAKRGAADPRFLYYLATSDPIINYLASVAEEKTAYPSVNPGDIAECIVPIPPLSEQRAIAHVLGTLDDKIELNRRMNETLEAMARAIFKSWFVDFDPVHAKAAGRQHPGLDPATASLFPDSFQDSELGRIPKGWRMVTIAELADFNAKTLGNNDELDHIEYIEISEVVRGYIGNIQIFQRGEEPSRARRRLRHGDTVLSTVRPNRGSYFLCLHPSPNLIASTGFAVVSPTKAPWSFIYLALTSPEVFEHLGQQADGGAYPAVHPEIIGQWQVPWPDQPPIAEAFHRTCAPLLERAEHNRRDSRTLAAIRDELLPNLLSGEVRVKNAV